MSKVRASSKVKKRIFVVKKIIVTGSGILRYKILPLNRIITCTVTEKDLEHKDSEPSNIPQKPNDEDSQVMIHCLSPEDIEKVLSGNVDNPLCYYDMITLYWHHGLQCMQLVSL